LLPRLLILETGDDSRRTLGIISDLKGDPVFGQIPIIAILPDSFEIPSWDLMPTDDYLRRKDVEAEVALRVALSLARADRIVEINPLTRLPGNITISRQIQQRLDAGELFALAYADLDYFKPFNDKYGFSRGDEVIKMVGRLILNLVREHQPQGSFVGHVGGDDFVFLVGVDMVEAIADNILSNYAQIVPMFYDADDRERGSIVSVDREGKQRSFPLMALSIGIAHNRVRKFVHYGEIVEVASEMKKHAKGKKGNACSIDRRTAAKKSSS
jgi:diguanylate cyclase (GGDEF)-like protein